MAEAQLAAIRAIFVAWLLWAAMWAVMSLGTKRVVRRESRVSRALHLVPLVVAAILLALPDRACGLLGWPILPRGAWMVFAGAALVLAGLGLAVWARLVLAGNWSGTVTLKASHELICRGPYALARHPIYTGLLTALLGTAIAIDAWRGLLAFVIVAVSFWRKMGTEEAFMAAAFGAAYEAYRKQTAALIPWIL
jgi:protein-S-isoprenylcysteine O-methyltransferase Ste14